MNNECKIVIDLLPSYVEDLLSPETEKFVKEHVENCSSCQKILDGIKDETFQREETINNEQKIELNHLKKYNHKMNILKFLVFFILGIILICTCIVIGRYKYNDSIMQESYNKVQEKKNLDNYIIYIEERSINYDANTEFVYNTEVSYKDGKYKEEHKGSSLNEEIINSEYTYYGEINSNKMVEISYYNKTITYETSNYNYISKGEFFDNLYPQFDYYESDWGIAGTIFKIGTNISSAKFRDMDCFIIGYKSGREIWIDKETMLPVREIYEIQGQQYMERIISLEIGKLSDSDLEIPQLDGYKVKENYRNVDDKVLDSMHKK